jgi:hypothetical protein
MTLKSKLAKLNSLAIEEERIKNEIAGLQSNIQDVELRQYNIAELRKKYSTLDFNNITKFELHELMKNDFRESNLDEIEKRAIYEHNMKILEQVLNKTIKQNESISKHMYNSVEDARNSINVNMQNDNIRTIEISGRDNEIEECFDEEYIEELNNKIDTEYLFNLKILKTYCIFCHYRNIKLPSQEELDEIKEELEGWEFLPKEKFKKLKYNEELYYLIIKNYKIILQKGNFKENTIWGIKCYNKSSNSIITLNKLNPIFMKITDI